MRINMIPTIAFNITKNCKNFNLFGVSGKKLIYETMGTI